MSKFNSMARIFAENLAGSISDTVLLLNANSLNERDPFLDHNLACLKENLKLVPPDKFPDLVITILGRYAPLTPPRLPEQEIELSNLRQNIIDILSE